MPAQAGIQSLKRLFTILSILNSQGILSILKKDGAKRHPQIFNLQSSIFNSDFRIPTSDFRIPPSTFPLPNSPTVFPQDFIDHGLCVGGRVGTGTVAAHMGGGLAFYDLQSIGVPGKFGQTLGIGT
jgi:hypothetical protein